MQKNTEKLSKRAAKRRKQQQKQNVRHQQKLQNKADQQQVSEGEDIDLNQVAQQDENKQEQVNFLVGEINQSYYHSLKTILLRFAQISKVTNSQLADQIVKNKLYGNVVLADDQEDDEQNQDENQPQDDQQNVYSVLTLISGTKKLSKSIKKIATKTAASKGISLQIQKIIENQSTGILINERLTNLPAFLVNSAHEVFKKDMIELKKNQKKLYTDLCSGYLLNISEIQFEGSQNLQDLIYSKFQDFQMCKRSKSWWLGQRNQSFKKKAEMRSLYYLISAEQYFKGVDNIKTYLED